MGGELPQTVHPCAITREAIDLHHLPEQIDDGRQLAAEELASVSDVLAWHCRSLWQSGAPAKSSFRTDDGRFTSGEALLGKAVYRGSVDAC